MENPEHPEVAKLCSPAAAWLYAYISLFYGTHVESEARIQKEYRTIVLASSWMHGHRTVDASERTAYKIFSAFLGFFAAFILILI